MGDGAKGIKHDTNLKSWESSEFPILCQGCLGDGFIRMIHEPFGGACKMCTRPFTIFKWRAGREYKKTEVCFIVSYILLRIY